jgi:hypothetical protein
MDYFDNLLLHYKTQAAAADAIGISRQVMSKYFKNRACPLELQIQWELDSGGVVRAPIPESLRQQVAA